MMHPLQSEESEEEETNDSVSEASAIRFRETSLPMSTSTPIRSTPPLTPRSYSLDCAIGASKENGQLNVPSLEYYRSVSGYIESAATTERNLDFVQASPEHFSSDGSPSLNNVLSYDEIFSTQDAPPSPIFSPASSNYDLQVRVDRPEKVLATMDTYVTFRVLTKTKRVDFAKTEFSVPRRYSDFVWLRQRLEQDYPMCLIPPLPEKHSVYSLDRFDAGFIRARCFLLHLFLRDLVRDTKLAAHPQLKHFLTMEFNEWTQHKKRSEISRGKLGESFYAMAASRFLGTPESEFVDALERCSSFGLTLAALDKLAAKWYKSESQTAQEVASAKAVMDHWAELERGAGGRLGRCLGSVSGALDTDARLLGELADRFEVDLSLPLKHWTLFAEAVKHVLKRRDQIQWEKHNAQEVLKRKEAERDTATQATSQKYDQKQLKLAQQVEEFKDKLAKCTEDLSESNSCLRKELQSWEEKRKQETLNILKSNVAQRVYLHRKCLEAWENALCELEKDDI